MRRSHIPARRGGPPPPRQAAAQGRGHALFTEALSLHRAGRLEEAEALYRRIIAIDAVHFEARHHLGIIHHQRGEHIAAIRQIDAALELKPDVAAAHNNRGVALAGLRRLDEAVESYDRALAIAPGYVDALFNRANALKDLNALDDALEAYDKVIALAPAHAVACAKRGNVLYGLQRFADAAASFDRAIALDPDLSEAWNNRGSALGRLKRFKESLASYERAVALKPDDAEARGNCLHARMHVCEWTGYEADCADLDAAVAKGVAAISPFQLLACASTPAAQLACARTFVASRHPAHPAPLWRGERYGHARIRVAYLSADLRDHPVAHLTAGLFAGHDRSRFETIGVSLADDGPSPIRERVKASFDRFLDVEAMPDREIAGLVRDLEVDIMVDLNGFTNGSRLGVFALKPAPIHVNYLGYAGTLGAGYCDYIIADRFVVPEEARPHYAEQVVHLPDTFMVNDSARPISARVPSRAEAGLPDGGFVFCCFNQAYKITPDVFGVWMRLLGAIEDSRLWLTSSNADAMDNLRREAATRGVDPARLVFAPKLDSNQDHLARVGLADLFLDTLPYNAHTTAADALWCGVPVLTCSGATFASRVAGSLLDAIGLPELITASLADYESLALRLAHDSARLSGLRQKLARNRDTHPLFDTARFTRHIEAAYATMWQRAERGEPPQGFAVDPIGQGRP